MKMEQQLNSKRVSAYPPASKPQAQQSKSPMIIEKIKESMRGKEQCHKHKGAYKIAYDAVSESLVCNQCLFE